MQKVWSFAIIALVGIIMITSSLPQEVFAGKDTLRLNLTVFDQFNNRVQDIECWVSANFEDAKSGDEDKRIGTDNTGKAGRATFTFEGIDKGTTIWANCDKTIEGPFEILLDEKIKNTRINISF